MRRITKKYQTPAGTLPSILEEGIPTQEDALRAMLAEMNAKRNKGIYNENSYNIIDGTYHLGDIEPAVATASSSSRPDSTANSPQRPDLMAGMIKDTSLLKQAADKAALDDMMQKQEDATRKAFSESIDAQRSKNTDGSKGGDDDGSEGSGKGLKLQAMSNVVSGLTDFATSFIDVDENSSFQQQQMAGDMLMKSGNPYAMAAGAAFKGLSAMDQALGINVNTINKKEAEFADISKGERILNNVLGFLPGT